MNKQKLQIFILCRDRVEFLNDVLSSAKIQKSDLVDVEIVISDNSVKNDVELFCKEKFPEIKYIRRNPPTDSEQHFKVLHKELSGDFIVFFHDDDILLPEYTSKMIDKILENPNASAIACNGLIIRADTSVDTLVCFNVQNNIQFNTEIDFLRHYLPGTHNGCAPFPSYMYRKTSLLPDHIDTDHGGKYSDVTFLAKKIKHGPIIWLHQPLIKYRIHGNNDSSAYSITDMRKLRIFMEQNYFGKINSEMIHYKYHSWYLWLFSKNIVPKSPFIIKPKTLRQYKVIRAICNSNYLPMSKLFFWRLLIGNIFFAIEHKFF